MHAHNEQFFRSVLWFGVFWWPSVSIWSRTTVCSPVFFMYFISILTGFKSWQPILWPSNSYAIDPSRRIIHLTCGVISSLWFTSIWARAIERYHDEALLYSRWNCHPASNPFAGCCPPIEGHSVVLLWVILVHRSNIVTSDTQNTSYLGRPNNLSWTQLQNQPCGDLRKMTSGVLHVLYEANMLRPSSVCLLD